MQKTVKIEEAVGMILAHDVTEIRKGEFKGPAFKKGHRIQAGDICHLQRLGKRHLYVLEIEEGYLHEDDAVASMARAFCGSGVTWSGEPREGKIELRAACDGLLKVEVASLMEINLLGEVICAARHTNSLVEEGNMVAATRAIPLVIQKGVVDEAVRIAGVHQGVFRVVPLRKAQVGIVITGNEIFTKLIEDQFEGVLRRKIDRIGSATLDVVFAPDDPAIIEKEIRNLLDLGADLILTTGGMSVDPDDVTREGARRAGGKDFVYGTPVLPGAMLMIADVNGVPLLGVPACGLYHETTVLDLVLPRILAGEKLTREDMASLGHGGLCLNCPECRFPVCPFGKSAA
jgi:molybdopterin biosynthesis enzyme